MTLVATVLAATLLASSPVPSPVSAPTHAKKHSPHAWTITYVNEDKGTSSTESSDDVPVTSRYVDGVRVVKVVYASEGNEAHVQEYGPKGELLRCVIGFTSVPSPGSAASRPSSVPP